MGSNPKNNTNNPNSNSYLRVLRQQRGLTQRQLSQLSGVAQPHISQYETGAAHPRLVTARRLADALKVDVEQLLTQQTQRDEIRLLHLEICALRAEITAMHATISQLLPIQKQ